MTTARLAVLPVILMALAALGGCATGVTMRSYVGHNVTDATLDYGAPVNAFDMPDGSRAFQWRLDFEHVPPTYANTSGPVTRYGDMTWTSTHTAIYGGQPLIDKCVYTLFAVWDDSRHGWTVRGFRRPNILCR
jgi:hypothetical protein